MNDYYLSEEAWPVETSKFEKLMLASILGILLMIVPYFIYPVEYETFLNVYTGVGVLSVTLTNLYGMFRLPR